jgi:hypothetical protein
MFLRLKGNRITAWLCGFSYVLRKNVSKNVSESIKKSPPAWAAEGIKKRRIMRFLGASL